MDIFTPLNDVLKAKPEDFETYLKLVTDQTSIQKSEPAELRQELNHIQRIHLAQESSDDPKRNQVLIELTKRAIAICIALRPGTAAAPKPKAAKASKPTKEAPTLADL